MTDLGSLPAHPEPRTPVTVLAGPAQAALRWLHNMAPIAILHADATLASRAPDARPRFGCTCCGIQDGVHRDLRALLPRARRGDIAHVVVAAADPIPVLTTLLSDPALEAVFRIGGVSTADTDQPLAEGRFDVGGATVRLAAPLDWPAIAAWLRTQVAAGRFERLTGVLHLAGVTQPVAVDAVRHRLARPVRLPAWPAGWSPASCLTVTGQDIDRQAIADAVRTAAVTQPAATG